jgi:hypothetical protein
MAEGAGYDMEFTPCDGFDEWAAVRFQRRKPAPASHLRVV